MQRRSCIWGGYGRTVWVGEQHWIWSKSTNIALLAQYNAVASAIQSLIPTGEQYAASLRRFVDGINKLGGVR